MKELLRRIFQNPFFKCSPRGLDLVHNLNRYLPEWKCDVIFDVGANIGQSAQEFSKRLKYTTIHCFEPFPSTFEELRKNTRGLVNIQLHPFALSSKSGEVLVNEGNCSTNNSITPVVQEAGGASAPSIQIETKTLTEVFEELGLVRISLLKIDTEGHDLEVLHGSELVLDQLAIDVIHVEAGMNPTNHHHVPFEDLKSYLESKSYFLFGVYEQTGEFLALRQVCLRD
jgi:FkbM family methyltransferase